MSSARMSIFFEAISSPRSILILSKMNFQPFLRGHQWLKSEISDKLLFKQIGIFLQDDIVISFTFKKEYVSFKIVPNKKKYL